MASKFQEQMATKLLADQLLYEIAGWDNEVSDGQITQEEFNERVEEGNLLLLAQDLLDEAYKAGYLQSNYTDIIVEAKHLKFGGKGKLEAMKLQACLDAFKRAQI